MNCVDHFFPFRFNTEGFCARPQRHWQQRAVKLFRTPTQWWRSNVFLVGVVVCAGAMGCDIFVRLRCFRLAQCWCYLEFSPLIFRPIHMQMSQLRIWSKNQDSNENETKLMQSKTFSLFFSGRWHRIEQCIPISIYLCRDISMVPSDQRPSCRPMQCLLLRRSFFFCQRNTRLRVQSTHSRHFWNSQFNRQSISFS